MNAYCIIYKLKKSQIFDIFIQKLILSKYTCINWYKNLNSILLIRWYQKTCLL